MKTLPLEEAKKLTASGDWMANKGTFYVGSLAEKTIDEFVGWCNQEDSFYRRNTGLPKDHPDKLSGDALDTKLQELQDRDRANAALLAHSMNIRDDLIEALERVVLLGPSKEGLSGHAPISAFIDEAFRIRMLLERVKKVEML